MPKDFLAKPPKATTQVFSTAPQKMDPPPAGMKAERKVADYAVSKAGGRKNPHSDGTSAGKVKAHAMRGPGARRKL